MNIKLIPLELGLPTVSLTDAIGFVGVLLILTAYFLLQTERLSTQQLSYQILNGLGAALVLVSLCFTFNLSAFIIEIVWLLISLYGAAKILSSTKTTE